jgi:hypothetical protein
MEQLFSEPAGRPGGISTCAFLSLDEAEGVGHPQPQLHFLFQHLPVFT